LVPVGAILAVKTRMSFKQVRMSFPPLVKSLHRRDMAKVCLRFSRLDQAMLNAVLRAFLIKDMFSSRLPLTCRTKANA